MVISSAPNGMSYQPINSGYVNGGTINAPANNLSGLPPSGLVNSGQLQSLCCLVESGIKCNRPSGNASYSKRIEKQVMQRKLRLSVDTRTSHTYICEHHKQIIQSIRTSGKRKRKDDDHANDDDMSINDFHDFNDHHSGGGHSMGFGLSSMKSYSSNSLYDVDLHSLQVNTLRRYKRHYRISTKPGLNKTQLAEELTRHFRTIPVNEKTVINDFMYAIKYNGNKLTEQNSKNND